MAGPPHTCGRGMGGTWEAVPLEGAVISTVVGTREVIEEEEVGAGAVGEEEGMGMEEEEEAETEVHNGNLCTTPYIFFVLLVVWCWTFIIFNVCIVMYYKVRTYVCS